MLGLFIALIKWSFHFIPAPFSLCSSLLFNFQLRTSLDKYLEKNIGHLSCYCTHRQICLLWLTLIFLVDSICLSNKQYFLLFCPLCMPLWQLLLPVFTYCSAWLIMGHLGIKVMDCLMVVRTIEIITLHNFLLGTWKIFHNSLSVSTVR